MQAYNSQLLVLFTNALISTARARSILININDADLSETLEPEYDASIRLAFYKENFRNEVKRFAEKVNELRTTVKRNFPQAGENTIFDDVSTVYTEATIWTVNDPFVNPRLGHAENLQVYLLAARKFIDNSRLLLLRGVYECHKGHDCSHLSNLSRRNWQLEDLLYYLFNDVMVGYAKFSEVRQHIQQGLTTLEADTENVAGLYQSSKAAFEACRNVCARLYPPPSADPVRGDTVY